MSTSLDDYERVSVLFSEEGQMALIVAYHVTHFLTVLCPNNALFSPSFSYSAHKIALVLAAYISFYNKTVLTDVAGNGFVLPIPGLTQLHCCASVIGKNAANHSKLHSVVFYQHNNSTRTSQMRH